MNVPAKNVRERFAAAIRDAAGGRAPWLDQAIRAAGYVPRGERATKGEVEDVLKVVTKALEEAGLECAGTCGEHWLDKAQRAIERIDATRPRQDAPGADRRPPA